VPRIVPGRAILVSVEPLKQNESALEVASEIDRGTEISEHRLRRARANGAPRAMKPSARPSTSGQARVSVGGAQSVDRAGDILLAFTHRQPVLTLGDIAEKSGLPKPTAHRLIQSLISRGLMQRTVEGKYELGFRLYELGVIARTRISLTTLASSALEALAAETGETVILSRADMDTLEIVVVDSRTRRHALGVRPHDGRRSLIPPGPQAKSLLAAMPPSELSRVLDAYARRGSEERQLIETGQIQQEIQRTRQRGYAVDEQDYIVGVTGVSSWLVFGNPPSTAAIAVVAPSERLSGARIARVGARVRELATDLSFTGYRERPGGG
jgi:DNA-binding IclR family transcriptional regulator